MFPLLALFVLLVVSDLTGFLPRARYFDWSGEGNRANPTLLDCLFYEFRSQVFGIISGGGLMLLVITMLAANWFDALISFILFFGSGMYAVHCARQTQEHLRNQQGSSAF